MALAVTLLGRTRQATMELPRNAEINTGDRAFSSSALRAVLHANIWLIGEQVKWFSAPWGPRWCRARAIYDAAGPEL